MFHTLRSKELAGFVLPGDLIKVIRPQGGPQIKDQLRLDKANLFLATHVL